jgi:phosphate ABC transporter permease protein PstC
MEASASNASGHRQDQRAERILGALACTVLVLIVGMIVFVFQKAWPSFSHNGLAWFGGGGNVDGQLAKIFQSPNQSHGVYTLHAWPLIYGTALTTFVAVVCGLVIAILSAAFIVEFAPVALRRVLEPIVRLLAAVPSVVYGLIGVLVLVPYVGNHLISEKTKASVAYVVELNGASLLVAVVILTVMITPIMIAIITDALRAVPSGWTEGALALGVNRWRVMWTVAVRAARPAIVAAVVLATARALGEAIMLAMVSGSVGFSPNPADGLIFFVEPSRPLAATILKNAEELTSPPMRHTLFAIAAVLLFSAAMLSLIGWAVKQPMKRYGVRA